MRMATTDTETPAKSGLARVTLTARIEERLIAPLRRNPFATRTVFTMIVVVVLAIHATVLAYLLHKDRADPVQPLDQKETPVEVVVEQPKPPPPPPPPAPQKQASKPEIEKPATSAPRAANEEKVATEQLDKETHAPKAPAPPTDGKPEPEKQAAAPDKPAETPDKEQTESAKKDEDTKKEADALDKAAPEPKPDPKPAKTIKSTVPKKSPKSALQQLAGTSSLPDYKFARPTKKSPVSGGTEDARYLAIVYGLVMQQFHPIGVTLAGTGSVSVAFEVGADGRILAVGVQDESGNPSFDAAAVDAVRRASPLPPPPAGSPHGLIARISAVGRS